MPTVTIDVPVGGINAYDSPENMAPTDAIALDNWICRSGYLESLPPFKQIAFEGVLGGVFFAAVYHGTGGNKFLIWRDDGGVFDYDDVILGTYTALKTGFPTTYMGMADITTFEINDRLIVLGGAFNETSYNGSTFTDLDFTGSSPAIPSGGAFTHGCNFKGRAIYVNEGDNSFWYAAAGSHQGVVTEFPLKSVAELGGYPRHVAVWTMDTGIGPDDTLVIYYNTGEVLLYQGDDPGDPDNWEIIGRFQIGKPMTKHASIKNGADLILLSDSGYVNLADVLRSDQRSDYPAFSRRIWPMVEDIIEVHRADGFALTNRNYAFRWDKDLIVFNFHMRNSATSNERYYQFVLNTNTGAWSRWTHFSQGWVIDYEKDIFQASGGLYKQSTFADVNDEILLSAIPAFTDLGDPNNKKHITAVQLYTNHPNPDRIEVTGYSDFNIEGTLPTPAADGGSVVDDSGVGPFPYIRKPLIHTTTKGWHNLHAFGFVVSMAVQMKSTSRILYWRQYTYRVRRAGGQ